MSFDPTASPDPISDETIAKPRRRRAGKSADGPLQEARSWATGDATQSLSRAPTMTFRTPGGQKITLATDRVRAKPALSPQLSFMLGQGAIALGLWGLLAPGGVNRFLGIRAWPGVTRLLFGAREMATGATLFSDPTRSGALWARVIGDAVDIAVLKGLTRASNPKRGNARLALGVVLAVTALDVLAAVRMSNVKRTCS